MPINNDPTDPGDPIQMAKDALLTDVIDKLQSQAWVTSRPKAVQKAGYKEILRITGSANGLADFVKKNGLQNLQNYSWWSSSPYKQQAWDILQGKAVTPSTKVPSTAPSGLGLYHTAENLFEQIKAGYLTPSQTDPEWTSLYKNRSATPEQKQAYQMWEDYMKTNPNAIQEREVALNRIASTDRGLPSSGAEKVSPPDWAERAIAFQDSRPNIVDETSAISFNTGNKELDSFLNNTLIPLFENEFSKDPLKVLDPEIFKNISQRIEATYGPLFQKTIKLAEDEFGRAQEQLAFQKERAESGFSTGELRTREDLERGQRRLEEDKLRALSDNARNFDEMKLEISNNFRQRGLTFSGLRQEGERKLEEANQRAIGDIERGVGRSREEMDLSGQRSLEDIGRERGFLGREAGFQQRGLEGSLTRERERISGERLLQEAEEKRRLQDLSVRLLTSSFR